MTSDYPFRSHLMAGNGAPDLSYTVQTEPPIAGDWMSVEPLMESASRRKSGEPIFSIYRLDGFEVMRFSRGANFYLWPDRIVCEVFDPSSRGGIELTFLGMVLSYWLEQRGVLMLHASAVAVGESAVAFMATKQGGKSSLAATLMQSGYPLLTDDLLPVRFESGRFMAFHGYPQMRLWPNTAQHFLGHYEDLEHVHPDDEKRRAPVGGSGFGSFCHTPATLTRIYLPERSDSFGGNPRVEEKSPSEAVIDLVRNSFAGKLTHATGLQPQRLETIAELVRHVPVKALLYPNGFEYLPAARETVLGDLEAPG